MSNENDDIRSRLGDGESLRTSKVDSSEQTDQFMEEIHTRADENISSNQSAIDKSDEEDEIENTYVNTLIEVLKGRYDDQIVKFTTLFRTRYALEPQVDLDEKLQQCLKRGSVTDRDLMYLSQKHLNEFGGLVP